MKTELYNEYQKLIAETNQYRNNGSRVKDVKKLRFMAVMKAAEQPEASPYNLRVLANENFRKYVVEIVYIDAVLDKNRQRRESREFFERNIYTRGMEISAAPILTDNLVRALTPEKINSYMTKIIPATLLPRHAKNGNNRRSSRVGRIMRLCSGRLLPLFNRFIPGGRKMRRLCIASGS